MALIVQKFGGSSVANAERVMNVASIVADTYKEGNDVVVVVSAGVVSEGSFDVVSFPQAKSGRHRENAINRAKNFFI